mmetsp:Transcript_15490/g.25211  ORF Transcript_15490/g.25211 Transcript_15490/m.25211 type:complete len:105 (+) Transcript_15490:1102-1416(+)
MVLDHWPFLRIRRYSSKCRERYYNAAVNERREHRVSAWNGGRTSSLPNWRISAANSNNGGHYDGVLRHFLNYNVETSLFLQGSAIGHSASSLATSTTDSSVSSF